MPSTTGDMTAYKTFKNNIKIFDLKLIKIILIVHLLFQIQDQQSLVVELSLLRQENEELTMTVAKQSSIIDKMKKDSEQINYKPKSPSVIRKSTKIGKENLQTIISPLRERNH